MDNNYYIVRANGAGVFFAKIKEKTQNSIILTECQHIYSWQGALNTTEIAISGISSGKISNIADEIEVFNVLQVNKCTEKAATKIKSIKPY